MSIIGIGNDIVETGRIADALARHGEHFTKRLLTADEAALGSSRKDVTTFYAGRWAAKEACAKALGCGIGEHCSFTDIEVLNTPNGAPQITLRNAALETFTRLGGTRIHCTISHEHRYAVATVIIE